MHVNVGLTADMYSYLGYEYYGYGNMVQSKQHLYFRCDSSFLIPYGHNCSHVFKKENMTIIRKYISQ